MTQPSSASESPGRGNGLVLVGYRGTGKSTVGKIVAKRVSRAFMDADAEIEARTGRSILSIFAEEGEPGFREWEERTIRELATDHPGAVLATGGGAILRAANRARLREFGIVIWLRAEPAELARRLALDVENGAERPALTAAGTIAEIAQVLEARAPLYRETADHVLDTLNGTPEAVAARILALWTP